MYFQKKDLCRTVTEVVERNTGLKKEDFLREVRDPFIKNLKEAVQFTQQYLADHAGKPVTIVGDYDSDGVNATSILYWAFTKLGADVRLRVPRRFSEGYGLSEKIIDEVNEGLLITVDNGIAAGKAIRKAKEKGLSVVVTDHHLPPTDEATGAVVLPPADVIVDPAAEEASEFHDYCGAAIAYRFAKELLPGFLLRELHTLAAIATVTDVMPLIGANRTLVRDGLQYINQGKTVPGLNALIQEMNLSHITEEDFGFSIGPAFNAPGRLYDTGASKVVKLLTAKRTAPELPFYAKRIVKANEERKALVKESMEIALPLARGQRPIVIYHPSFGEGIVGIIAGRLTEVYDCPAIVFTDSEQEGVIKGSGRSPEGIHLKHSLDQIREHILKFGGHAGAAGLSIEKKNLEQFRAAFQKSVGEIPEKADLVEYDLELDPRLGAYAVKELNEFAPYGQGNPKIVYHAIFDTTGGEYGTMGDGSHFVIRLADPAISLMGFGLTDQYREMGSPKRIECVGHLSESWYNGKPTLQFQILNMLPA